MRSKLITSIEIKESHIKILKAFSGKRGVKVSRLIVKKISDPSEEGVTKLLASMVDFEMKKSRVVVSIPRSQAMLRYFSFPSHSESEIQKMLSLQIPNQIPYQRQDVVFDYTVLDKDSRGYSRILVIIVHKDIIRKYFTIFKSVGLSLDSLTLSSSSIINGFFYNQKMVKEDKLLSAFADIDIASSELCFCKNAKLLFSRNIKFGAQDIQADYQKAFIRDIVLTLEAYSKDNNGESVQRLILFCPERSGSLLKKALEQEINLSVEVFDPCEIVKGNKDILVTDLLQGDPFSPLVVFGSVLSNPQKPFNLLPEDVGRVRKSKEKRNQWAKFVGLVFLCGLLISGMFMIQFYKQKDYFQNLKNKVSEIEPRVKDIKQKKQHIVAIESYLNPGLKMVDIIYNLYEITPKDISYRLLYINGDGRINIKGISERRASVNDFQKELIASSLFKEVNLKYATQRKVFEGEIIDFKITCKVNKP